MDRVRPKPALGIIFYPTFPPETLPEYARRAEAAGFDELWLWDDSFLPGALTSAAIALSATRQLKVGIGLMPATVYNPLFVAMELTTLARAFPGRILPGFGHGVAGWLEQIGAAPKSSMKALAETVTAVRSLLAGEMVTMHGEQVRLEEVQMHLTAGCQPPIYVGAMRAKTLQLAGQLADGTILTGMSSPEYVRWACEQIGLGVAASGRAEHRVVTYLDVKVDRDASAARAMVRKALAERLPWADVQLDALGITGEVAALVEGRTQTEVALQMPEEWVDYFAAAGTAERAAAAVLRLFEAGADSVVFQPLNGDPACLDEYARELMPRLLPDLKPLC